MHLAEFIERKKYLLEEFGRSYKTGHYFANRSDFPAEQEEQAWHEHFSWWLRECFSDKLPLTYDTAPKVLPTPPDKIGVPFSVPGNAWVACDDFGVPLDGKHPWTFGKY